MSYRFKYNFDYDNTNINNVSKMTVGSIVSGVINSTNISSINASLGSLYSSTINTGSHNSTIISAGSINATGITVGKLYGNVVATSISSSNYVGSFVSSGSIGASGITTGALYASSVSAASLYLSGGITTNNINFTGSLYQNGALYSGGGGGACGGSFNAANNVTSPSNITNFVFTSSATVGFSAIVTVNVNANVNLCETFSFYGSYSSSGWMLITSSYGDISGFTFSITPSGQIQYTSTNIYGWTSSIIRYTITQNNINMSYTNPTSGNTYTFDSIALTNTSDAIANVQSGSLNISGGATVQKSLIVGSLNTIYNYNTIGNIYTTGGNVGISTTAPGYLLDVNGSAKLTTTFINMLNATSGSINNLSVGSNLYVGGSVVSVNVTTMNLIDNNLSTGSLNATNAKIIAISSGTLDLSTGITTANINFTGNIYKNGTLYVGSQWTTTNGNSIFYTGGNVGIGTTAPSYMLDINGSVRVTSSFIASNNCNTIGNLYTMSGNVGIGTTAPVYPLHVNGAIYASGDISAFSDSRLKDNIVVLTGCLDKIDNWKGVSFRRIDTGVKHIGLIAQDVEIDFPELIATNEMDGYKSVKYGNTVAVLLECIKELKNQNNDLKSRIEKLELKLIN